MELNRNTATLDQDFDILSLAKNTKTNKLKINPNLKFKQLKVLYIFTNIDGYHYDNYHFGLATLVSVTKNLGHDVKLNLLSKREQYTDFKITINEFQPDIVGFSSVSSQFPFVKELAKIAKDSLPNVITIAGGVHPTLSTDSLLEADYLDGFIRGEAEEAIVDFLINVSNGLSYKETDNFAYVEDGKVISNELKPLVKDLDELPLPDKEIYPYYENTIKLIRSALFFFTRGCPYTCTYCMNQSFADLYGRKRNFPRYRSPESCIQEIEDVVEKHHKDIEYVFIGDDIFGPNLKWRKEFCD
jgi:anaerobic magnesium-protoporphyrin IX monomethyl ester cyclase